MFYRASTTKKMKTLKMCMLVCSKECFLGSFILSILSDWLAEKYKHFLCKRTENQR